MKHRITLLLLLAAGCATKPPDPTPSSQRTPDYMSLQNLDKEIRFAERWREGGTVVMGRIDLPSDAKVTSRTRIFPDGSFAAAVAPGRQIVFYAHGYDPLRAKVYDAGNLSFSRAASENSRTVKCTISLTEPDEDAQATIQLMIYNHSFLFQDAGHSGGHVELVAETKKASDKQTVVFDGLSRNPYKLVFTAPGYIQRCEIIDPKKDGLVDLGQIDMFKAKTLEITYRARVRQNGGPWATDDRPQRATIVCDGASELEFSDLRTGLGGKLHLLLLPRGNDVAAYFPYSWTTFYPLDSESIHNLSDFDSIVFDESVEADNEIMLENNGLYFFRAIDLDGTDVELVFQPKEIPPAK